MTRFALAVFLTIGMIQVQAQTLPIVADIGISVRIEPGGAMPSGTEGIIYITITNDGPDIGGALFTWVETDDGTSLSYPPLFSELTPAICTVWGFGQPRPGNIFGLLEVREIPPGESRICSYAFRVLDTSQLMQVARWEAAALDGLALLNDPNPANNEDEVLLIFSALADVRPVPILSLAGLFILILLIFSVTARRIY